MKKQLCSVFVLLSLISTGEAVTTTWISNTGGDWNNAANWSNGIPNAPGDVAQFLTEPLINPTIFSTLATNTLQVLDIDNFTTLSFNTVPNFTFTATAGSPSLLVGDNQSHVIFGSSIIFTTPTNVNIGSNSVLNIAQSNSVGQLNNNGPGTLLLTGNGAGTAVFQVTVNGGVVQAGSSASDSLMIGAGIVVNPGGTLDGFGTILAGTSSVANSGVVMPGNYTTTGTLTITSTGGTAYSQSAGGTLTIKAEDPAAYDVLAIVDATAGSTTLAGTLFLNAADGLFLPGDEITVLRTTGTLTGTFGTFDASLPPGLVASVLYTTDAVDILFALGGPPPLLSYLNLIDPLILLENGHMHQLSRRLDKLRCRVYCSSPCNQNSVYVAGIGSWGELDRIKTQGGYDFDSGGFILGADRVDTCMGWGAYISYERLHASVQDNWGNFYVDNLLGKIYATWFPTDSCLFANFAAGGGYNWFNITRHASYHLTTKGKSQGWEANVWAELGWENYFSQAYYVIPLASLDYNYFKVNAYSETGGDPFGVHYDSEHVNSLRSSLGFEAGKAIAWGCLTIAPEVRLCWEHEFLNYNRSISISALSYASTEDFNIYTAGGNFGSVGGAISLYTNSRISLTGSYDYTWNSLISVNELYGELAWNF